MRPDRGAVGQGEDGRGTTPPDPHSARTGEALAPQVFAPLRPPRFTVGSAVRWLGHECPESCLCCAPIDSLTASVWFLRRAPHGPTVLPRARVLVDTIQLGDGVAALVAVLHHVNGCTGRDGIEVRWAPRGMHDRLASRAAYRVPTVPTSPLMHCHPVEMPGPSDDDLRTVSEAHRW